MILAKREHPEKWLSLNSYLHNSRFDTLIIYGAVIYRLQLSAIERLKF